MDEMRMTSEALDYVDKLHWRFNKLLCDAAFSEAHERGREVVQVIDVQHVLSRVCERIFDEEIAKH